MVALSNVVEFAWVFDEDHYNGTVSHSTAIRRNYARWRCNHFKALFKSNHLLQVENNLKNPQKFLFDPSLVQFVVSLVKYKRKTPGCNFVKADALDKVLHQYLTKYHPRLVDQYERDKEAPDDSLEYLKSFEWAGDGFAVVPHPHGPEYFQATMDAHELEEGPSTEAMVEFWEEEEGSHKRSLSLEHSEHSEHTSKRTCR